MLIYVALYIVLISLSFFIINTRFSKENTGRKIFCAIAFICLFLLLALRHPSMGVDLGYGGKSTGYLKMYEKIATMSWGEIFSKSILNYEKGYVVFNKLLSYISKDSQFLLAICALLCTLSSALLIYKNSKKPLLSTIIYIALPAFLINFSGLRQAVAVSITMLAFQMIKEKKIVKFILLVILASTFHSSAIIFLLAYPLYHIKHSNAVKIISFVAIPVVFVLRTPLFMIFSRLFKEDAEVEETGAFTLFIIFALIYVVLLVFTNNENELSSGTTNIFWFACICQAFGGVYNTAMRVGYYFMIYLAIALPEVINEGNGIIKLSRNYKRVAMAIVFACFCVYGLYAIYQGGPNSWYMTNPYKFFWQ